MDLRDYKGTIREAVRRERNCDQNWSWKVLAISKEKASIAWTYLTEYLGEKSCFEVRVIEDKMIGTAVEAKSPDGFKTVRFIGEERWNDFKTVEEGLASAIHGVALHAHWAY